jgi:hypothetical protein
LIRVSEAYLIWRPIPEAGFNMEANYRGGFTYGGGFWSRLFYSVYIKGMSGAFFNMEADLGGGFTYVGGFWRQIPIWRRITGADFNMEADFGGSFQCAGEFVLHRGRFVLHVKAIPVNLCHRSSTRGGLQKSI